MEMLDKIMERPKDIFVMERWKGPPHLDLDQLARCTETPRSEKK